MKAFKNIIINLICIALLCAVTDFIICIKKIKNEQGNSVTFKFLCNYYKERYRNYSVEELENRYVLNKDGIYRPVENKDSKLPPILIFSDSFLYSYNVNGEDETFSYVLGQITKRPVYNRGFVLTSYPHVLFQLKNEKFYKIIPKPKDIIYSLKENTITTDVIGISPWMDLKFYYKKDKNGNLVFHKYSFFESIMSIRIFSFINDHDKYTNEMEEVFLVNMEECKKEVENHWGKDVRFYIIVGFAEYKKYMQMLKKLDKLGFKVIYPNDNFFKDKRNFTAPDNFHLSKIGNEKLAKYTNSIIKKN